MAHTLKLILSLALAVLLFAGALAMTALAQEDGLSCEPEEETVRLYDGTDNDELFAAYVDSLFGVEETSAAEGALRMTLDGLSAAPSSYLTGIDAAVYSILEDAITQVAAGELDYTIISIPLEDVGLDVCWTAEDLGVSSILNESRKIADDAKQAAFAKGAVDFSRILKILLAEHPYELYWFDKVSGMKYTGYGLGYRNVDGVDTLYPTQSLRFKFPVSADYTAADSYSETNQEGKIFYYNTDADKGAAAQTAAENAREIVLAYEDASDTEKLRGYLDTVCGLVTYDRDALQDGTPYGDPWQIISVFDGDEDTNVVCEGYSKAFQYLCEMTDFDGGISCVSVTGELIGGTGSGGHMWNIVTLDDGVNYLVDATNCDSGTVGAPDVLFLRGYTSGSVEEGYLIACTRTRSVGYVYNDTARIVFSEEDLTLPAEDVVVEPTCTEEGSLTRYYGASGYVTTAIEPLGHDYAGVVTPQTDTEPGFTTYTCARCGDMYEEEIPEHEHEFDAVVTEPTCTDQGFTTYTCGICLYCRVDDQTDALGHRYGEPGWMWAEDLSSASAAFTCSRCGDVQTVDADVTVERTEPTYEETGSEVYTAAATFEDESFSDVCLVEIPKLIRTGWQQIEGVWYYYDENGVIQTSWQRIGENWYYFQPSGAMSTGWQKIDDVWYFFRASGAMATGWQQIGGVWYYFRASGAMSTGWEKVNDVWYYFRASGAMSTGWEKVNDVWYYFRASGAMVTGWQKIDGVWYFFRASGVMVTGWQQIDGVWYYFRASGAMSTGWQQIDGVWYYFRASGAMVTGWSEIAGKWYYFYPSGAMAVSTVIDGRYTIDANGVWVS